ncbi:hypothetical protein E4U33_007099 [Claviceps sp. LM78 group G4]|nr:hypothetical protein E4U33_007099 [Claviceps sp. LM78 group G4]
MLKRRRTLLQMSFISNDADRNQATVQLEEPCVGGGSQPISHQKHKMFDQESKTLSIEYAS